MKSFKVGMLVVLGVGFLVTGAWAVEGGWKKIGESHGIVGYNRSTPLSSVDEMKGIGMVDVSVAAIEALIRDAPSQKEYMYKCKEAGIIDVPEFKNTTDAYALYNVTSMPYPVKNRLGLCRVEWSIDKSTGTVYCHTVEIKTSADLDNGNVRMPLIKVDYILTPKGQNKTEVTYQALADPGGNVPAFVVNLMTRNLSIQTIAGIRDMVKKDKYKNAKAVVTTTPHK